MSHADTGISMINGQYVSLVMLTYQRPGLFLQDSTKVAFPTILVVTRRIGAEYQNEVSGGAMALDGQTEQVLDAGTLSASDQSFSVRKVSSGGGGGGVGRYTIDGDVYELFFDYNSSFNRFTRCTGRNAIVCIATQWYFGGPGLTPLKIAAIMAAPEIGMSILGGCTLIGALTCIMGS